MAGQANLQRVVERFAVISANTTAIALWTYHITTASTITLPNPATLTVGDWVAFTKRLDVFPTISRFGSELIQSDNISSTSFPFRSNAKLLFVFNGTDWEVINIGETTPLVLTGGGAIPSGVKSVVITDSSSYTLPDTTPFVNGYELEISWFASAVPTLNRQGSTTLLRRVGVTDTNLVCDVETKISLYLNKPNNIWEIR